MRLFLYYAFHTFLNQLKKLFKTWVLVFIVVCALFGGIIGFLAATLSNAAEERAEESIDWSVEEDSDTSEEEWTLPEEGVPDPQELMEDNVITGNAPALLELIGGILVLGIFIYEAMSADKNGSRIFIPADVNILFASPMRPQSVLMFRVLTQLGMAIFLSIYLLLQLPNLVGNLGLSLMASLGVIISWGLTIGVGKMIQVLLYTLCSTKPERKKYISRSVYVLLGLIVLGFIVFSRVHPVEASEEFLGIPQAEGLLGQLEFYYRTFQAYFNAPVTRFIPLWGWIKAFLFYSASDNLPMAGLFLLLTILGCGVLVYLIYHVKADFYEDAMAKSEETAELLERAQTQANGGIAFARRKKDRADSIRRDGLNHGKGAAMFFHKTMYNRFRFGHFGFLTKTAETYLVAAALLALFLRFVIQTDSIIPVALMLAGFSFFRSLGNPLEQDTKMSYFQLVPEKTYKKLFFSLMGGSLNCLLDLLLGLLAGCLILGNGFTLIPGWALVIVSVDMYATVVGAFIDLSIPVHTAKTIKQMVQIMFIYFGLLPDIVVVAVALVFSTPLVAIISVIAVNLILTAVFFVLSTLAIDYSFGK